MSLLIAFIFAIIVSIAVTIPWLKALEKDYGEYNKCIGCQRVDCNDDPESCGGKGDE